VSSKKQQVARVVNLIRTSVVTYGALQMQTMVLTYLFIYQKKTNKIALKRF